MSDLVERLRKNSMWRDRSYECIIDPALLIKAADRIEALEAELARVNKLAEDMAGALRSLPVNEWVEQESDGLPTLIGYVMQAQGEWYDALSALAAWEARDGQG